MRGVFQGLNHFIHCVMRSISGCMAFVAKLAEGCLSDVNNQGEHHPTFVSS